MKKDKDSFGDRMKGYECVPKNFLMKKQPVIIRLDGRSWHTWTKGLEKPFDAVLGECMARTAEYLLNNIVGCQFAYTQSDEISLLLVDYQTEGTEPWFDNNQQKLVSISSAMATLAFNTFWNEYIITGPRILVKPVKDYSHWDVLRTKQMKAMFDARAFNIPKEEVLNYFIARQQDATKNSISMLAQAHFSHRQLQGKNGKDKQDMLMLEKGINWNDIPTRFKRGVAVYKKEEKVVVQYCYHEGEISDYIKNQEGLDYYKNATYGPETWAIYKKRNKSYIDYEMPILTQDREFIKGY